MTRDVVYMSAAALFPGRHILQSLIAKLGWTHFQHLVYLDYIRDAVRHKFTVTDSRRENADGSRASQN